jgi:hypothetical protein
LFTLRGDGTKQKSLEIGGMEKGVRNVISGIQISEIKMKADNKRIS